MPISPYVKKLQKETEKSVEELQEHWNKAKEITEETFGVSQEEFTDREYEFAYETTYRILGLDEQFNIAEFIQSDLSAKEFIEQAVQTSGDFSNVGGEGGQTNKKKPYKDDPEEPGKVKEFETEEGEDERKYKQDSTGPHGQGAGPGQGKADGSGRKPGSKMSYEEEAIFAGRYAGEVSESQEEIVEESEEEPSEEYKEMLKDEALPNE